MRWRRVAAGLGHTRAVTTTWTRHLAAGATGYLLGSVPTAVLVARRRGLDPRTVGDRNPGYWNVKEQLGRSAAAPVFAGDVVKGAAAGVVGRALDPGDGDGGVSDDDGDRAWTVGHTAVAAAMVGHAYPVFAGFRGGRSVLTFVGGTVALAPVPAAVTAVGAGVTWARTGRFDIAARVGVFGFPVVQLGFERKERVAATGVLMTLIGVRFAQAAIADRRR